MSRGMHIITAMIEAQLPLLPDNGLATVFLRHTSAALTVNESADPTVRTDFDSFLDKLIPDDTSSFNHNYEGADDMPAHLKSSIIGQSVTIPIRKGRLDLGTWQGIWLCEFRNKGGSRKVTVTIIS